MASDSSDGVDYGKLADKIIDRAMATGMTRREVVSAVAGAGAAGTAVALASNRASAQDSLVIDGIDQIGRDGDRVQTLYVDNIDNYTSSETFDSVTVSNNLDAGSISTESASIGTVDGNGGTYRLIDRVNPGSTLTQFTGLSGDTMYRLFYNIRTVDPGETAFVRLNGDGATTGDYLYWDASATKQPDQNEFLLAEVTGSTAIAGWLTVTNSRLGQANRTGIRNDIMTEGNLDRVVDFGREGGRDATDGLSSIDIYIDAGGFDESLSVIELWERDYS